MTTIAELGFKVDTSDIVRGDKALDNLGRTGDRTADKLDKSARQVNNSFVHLKSTLGLVGAALVALGSAKVLNDLVRANREFGQSIADLSAITGAAGADLKFYSEQAKEIGRTTSLSASQAAEAFKLIASAKPDLLATAEGLTAVTKEAVTLAEAAGILLPEAASALGSALNQFQLDADQANEAINILAASSKLGAAEIPFVTEALKNAGSAANALDVDLAETVAGIQALAAAGIKGAEAGTALRQVLLRLERTADAELQPSIVGLDAAIEELARRQLSTVELMKLFGDEAFSSATAILAQQEALAKLNVTLRDTDTATEQASIRMDTLNGDILELNSALEGLQLEIFGDETEGLGRDITQNLTGAINGLTENLDALTDAGIALASVLGAGLLGPALINFTRNSALSTKASIASAIAKEKDALSSLNLAKSEQVLAAKRLAGVKDVAAALQAEVALETQRLKAQISTIGRTQSLSRLAEVQAAKLNIDRQAVALGVQLSATNVAAATSQDLYAKSTARATLATQAWGIATKIALGPVGLIVTALGTAGIAFAMTKKETDLLSDSIERQDKLLGDLVKKYDEFSSQRIGFEYANAIAEINALEEERAGILSKMNSLQGRQKVQLPRLRRDLEENSIALADAKTKAEAINKVFESGLPTLESYTDATNDQEVATLKLLTTNNELDASYQQLIDRLDPLGAATRNYSRESDELLGLFTDGVISLDNYIELIGKLDKEYKDYTDGLSDTNDEIENSIDKFDRLGASLTNTGNGIIDTFGEAISVLTEFGNRIEYITEEQEKYRAVLSQTEEGTQQNIAAKTALAKLDEAALSANLAGIGSLLGASANLFKEQSKEREILHRLEMGFLVTEMALAAKKAVVNAVNAITNQGNGDPYSAFARIPAMTGIMVGVLGAIGASISSTSGGYSAPTAGTGTVLGDSEAQSGSISDGAEMFEDIQLDQLSELRGIRSSMSDLAGVIGQVTKSIIGSNAIDTEFVQGLGKTGSGSFLKDILSADLINAIPIVGDIFGGIVSGLFGSTKRKLIDSGVEFLSQTFGEIFESGQVDANVFAVIEKTKKKLFGLISNSSNEIQSQAIDSEFSNELANIFTSIGETIVQSTALLGFGTEEALLDRLSNFNFESFQISTEGKTGEEIQEELEAAFSAQADLMAEFLLPQIAEFQQLGEGLYETLLRVTKEQVIFNDALRLIGMNIDNLNSSTLLAFSQAVIEASGGLDNFTDSFGAFYEKFFTEEEKALNTLSSLTDIFSDLGLELPDTMEEFRDLVNQTAMLGESGAETFAVLLSVSDAFAEMVETLNDIENATKNLENQFWNLFQFFGLSGSILDSFISGPTSQSSGIFNDAIDTLVEDFGSSGAVISAIENFSDSFLSQSEQIAIRGRKVFAGFFDFRQMLNDEEANVTQESADALRLFTNQLNNFTGTADELSSDFTDLIMGLDSQDISEGVLTGLLQLTPALSEYIDMLRQQEEATRSASEALENQRLGLYVELLDEQGHSQEALAIRRQQELEAMDESLRPLQSLIWLQEDWNRALTDSENALGSALDMLSSAVSSQASEISNIISSLDAALDSISSGLRNLESARVGTMEVALRGLDRILAGARGGDFSDIGQLDISTLTAGNTSGFSTAMDFNLAQARIGIKLEELAQLTQDERDSQQTELDALNSMLELAQQQYDAIMGVEEVITDAEAANVLFNQRLIELQALQLAGQDTSLEGQQEFADLQLALIEAQNVNFLALMDLTDEQRQQIVDHLVSLNQVNESFNETFANSFALLTTNMAGLVGANDDNFDVTIDKIIKIIAHQQDIDFNTHLSAQRIKISNSLIDSLDKSSGRIESLLDSYSHNFTSSIDYLTEILKTHYTVTALNMGHNQRAADILHELNSSQQIDSNGVITVGIGSISALLNHQQDIDFNTHLASQRLRIGNEIAHENGLKIDRQTDRLIDSISNSNSSNVTSISSAWSRHDIDRFMGHQQDIDHNTHLTAARVRIVNSQMEELRSELVKIRLQMNANDEKERRYLSSIDKNTEETERNLKNIELNGIRLRA